MRAIKKIFKTYHCSTCGKFIKSEEANIDAEAWSDESLKGADAADK